MSTRYAKQPREEGYDSSRIFNELRIPAYTPERRGRVRRIFLTRGVKFLPAPMRIEKAINVSRKPPAQHDRKGAGLG